MNSIRKDAINTAIMAGAEPKTGKSSATTLRLRQTPGRASYTVLTRADGSLTKAGEHYYTSTGRAAPSAQFSRDAPLIKKGANDYVTTRDGKLSLVRRLNPDGTTQISRLGKQYFRGGKTEYVVSIPVVVSGRNAKGRVQDRFTSLPVDMLGLGRILQNTSEP